MFQITFNPKEKKQLYKYWDEIFKNNIWCHGKFTQLFEDEWSKIKNLHSVSFSSWSTATQAVFKYYNLENETVLCPSNTFQATPMVSELCGAKIQYVDCNKFDFCVSYEDLKIKIKKYKPKALWVVHIGGHISFEIEKISELCKRKKIILIEDCAHAHGASYNGKYAGSWGDAGIYSFYATKTITTGEGGMLVSKNKSLINFSKMFKNYGKPNQKFNGLNARMSEFTAALGYLQTKNLLNIIDIKNEYVEKIKKNYQNYLKLPDGMISGYYKFIVFDEINNSTGKVYENGCHKIFKKKIKLPNTEWVSKNHWCVPIKINFK